MPEYLEPRPSPKTQDPLLIEARSRLNMERRVEFYRVPEFNTDNMMYRDVLAGDKQSVPLEPYSSVEEGLTAMLDLVTGDGSANA